jgi:D-glycero-alpha-D-manno-heptose-7-phosphate kinase
MQVTETGSVRVDLVGGTLDLEPINLIIPNVVTLNVATSLKAKVVLEEIESNQIIIESLDYNKTYEFNKTEMTSENLYYSDYFKEMSFVLQIISLFSIESGLKVTMSSGAPAGSGLGGSSAMGVTLFKALSKLKNIDTDVLGTVYKVKGVEGRILNQGVPGYQDYFPALLGGILCLKGTPGEIHFEQLYCDELRSYLETHITLVYSGISRNSGINNWDVYKQFFDGDKDVRSGLGQIADVSYKAYGLIKTKNYTELAKLIGLEGELRKSLAANIVPEEVTSLYSKLESMNLVSGIKMCGAGGGGCYILTHEPEKKDSVCTEVSKLGHVVLDFKIESPL